ncbi:hypothetical protein HZS_491 [Henneguya salminicola]|uniref:Ras-related protein Ral-A (Trinotate prediction) n=1 Tax=Henneguya salminicola TaxID=69463 RepID=A0A6G3MIB9_HENSL|nr:hypothetical protein HZS_491 [Henneguya salminicola]
MSKSTTDSIEITILGCGGVGKSALTLKYMYDEFSSEYEPTKSDAYKKTIEVDGKPRILSIIDTAGQEDYGFLVDNNIRKSRAFLAVFSLTEKKSFDAIDDFLDKIYQIKKQDEVVVLLVGNKKDLADSNPEDRKVSIQEAKIKADKYNIKFMESSAKDDVNVKEIFSYLSEQIVKKYFKMDENSVQLKSSKKRIKCVIL